MPKEFSLSRASRKYLAMFLITLIAAAGCAHQGVKIVNLTGETAKSPSGKKLKLTRFVAPQYPAELRAAHIEGTVEVQFDVVFDGTVTNLTVTKSAHPKLDELALIAVAAWKFEPRNPQDAETARYKVPVSFKVDQ